MINFDLPSYVTYNVLTSTEKIQFFLDIITNGIGNASEKLYQDKFKEFYRDYGNSITILTYLYKRKYRVNIIQDGDVVHMNSTSKKALEDAISRILRAGDIIISSPTTKRPKVCHLRHYRNYRKLNPPFYQFPIFYS